MTLQELEGKHEPGPSYEGNVDESDDVTEEPNHQDLHVAVLGDDLEAVEVGPHLGNVVDDGSYAKYGRVSAIVLSNGKYLYFLVIN